MKKWANKSGVALILTISVMTALSVLGITFLRLLMFDQRNALYKTNAWANSGAVEGAVQAGFWEIRKMQSLYSSNYFASTIESSDVNSPFYFKNTIRATNTLLNIRLYSPEVDHVLRDNLGALFSPSINSKMNAIANALYTSNWKMKTLSEITKVSSVGPDTYEKLLPILTTQGDDNGCYVTNILDYGRFDDSTALGANNRFRALARDFKPDATRESVAGAWIKIISGTGKDQVRKITGALALNSPVLVVDSDWSPVPDATSCYRIFTFVCPLNFNGADPKLIEANLNVIAPLITTWGGLIGTYASGNDNRLLGQLYLARAKITKDSLFKNEAEFLSLYLNNVAFVALNARDEFLRMFDPEQPKGIWDGTSTWKLYPVPVPWTFEHSGLFDMEIDAGIKRNYKQTGQPQQLQKKYLTVRISGKRDQTTREEFEGGVFQNWVSTSDWVPVRSMADMANWDAIYNLDFKPYDKTGASANVIPDSIKTGLWFDFNAVQDGRGSDAVFDQIAGTMTQAEDLYRSSFFTVSTGAVTQDLTTGRLQISGSAAGVPASRVHFGPSSGNDNYVFGDVAIVTDLQDESVFPDPFPHTTDPTWYTSGVYNPSHTWDQHKLTPSGRETYPPERWFTPTMFLRNEGLKSMDLHAERMFSVDTDIATCDIFGVGVSPADYTLTDNFSLSLNDYSKKFSNTPVTYDYLQRYQLFSAAFVQGITNYVRVHVKPINPSTATQIDLALSDPFVPTTEVPVKGLVGFKRNFPVEYFPDFQTGMFSVGYLRVMAGKRPDDNVEPFFKSGSIQTTHLERFSKCRLHYRVGAGGTQSFKFKIALNFYADKSDTTASSPGVQVFPAGNMPALPNPTDSKTMSGYFEFDLPNPVNLSDSVQYKYTVQNSSGNDLEHLAFLQSTIAITKVEIIYDTVEEVISSADTL